MSVTDSIEATNRSSQGPDLSDFILSDSDKLGQKLKAHNALLLRPSSRKILRELSSREVSGLLGITDAYLRQVTTGNDFAQPERTSTGRYLYTLEQVNAIRRHLARAKPAYLPRRGKGEHLQLISVANFKGGSGKTTTAVHLIQYLALKGYRVLAVDIDAQASLTTMFGLQPEYDVHENETFYAALRYDGERRPIAEIVRKTYIDGIDLVPANVELQEFEHQTAHYSGVGNAAARRFFTRIADALSAVEPDYDIVVFDCPPQLGFMTLATLCASTAFILSIHPQMLDVASMNQFLAMAGDMLSVVRRNGAGMKFDWMRYLITRYEPNDVPQAQVVAFLRSIFEDRVLQNMMLKSTAVSDAGIAKQTLYEMGKERIHRQTYERAIEAVNAVNGEIEGLIRAAWGRR